MQASHRCPSSSLHPPSKHHVSSTCLASPCESVFSKLQESVSADITLLIGPNPQKQQEAAETSRSLLAHFSMESRQSLATHFKGNQYMLVIREDSFITRAFTLLL